MNEMKLHPDIITITSVLKAFVNSRSKSMMSDIKLFLTKFRKDFSEISVNEHFYCQLLRASKFARDKKQARVWFDELLALQLDPNKILCDLFRDTVGEAAYSQYLQEKQELFDMAASVAASRRVREHHDKRKSGGRSSRGGGGGRGSISSSTSGGVGYSVDNRAVGDGGGNVADGGRGRGGGGGRGRDGSSGSRVGGRGSRGGSTAGERIQTKCNNWEQSRLCKFGDSCRFSHLG